MEPRRRTFQHNGRRLAYEVHGTGDRLVVYLHGLLLDSELNREIAESLAGHGFKVVLLDLLGHGRSEKPPHASEYRIDSYAHQTIALLDHLGAERAVLGGLSLGANVSLFVAARHPARVSGLVLEMPVLEWAVPSAALAFVPLLLAAHYGRHVLGPLGRIARALPRTSFGTLDTFLNAASVEPEVIAAVLHGVLVGPVAPTIDERRHIEAPTLILGHRHDLIHPFDDATSLTRQLVDAELVRARSPLELRLRPGRLTARIASFADDCWERRPPPARLLPADSGSPARGRLRGPVRVT